MLLDKNPGMTIMLPLINWAFPEMKLLIALRDPRDVVLSCFMQKVPLTPISSAWLSLTDAAEYYARCMSTWLKIRELTDKSLAENFAMRMLLPTCGWKRDESLDFLGLPWDENVLSSMSMPRRKSFDLLPTRMLPNQYIAVRSAAGSITRRNWGRSWINYSRLSPNSVICNLERVKTRSNSSL